MTDKRDIIIIGGGAIGLCSAYYLRKSGRGVTVIDSGKMEIGSSTGNAGLISASHIIPLAAPGVVSTALKWMTDPTRSPFGMKFSLDPAYLGWLISFAASCNQANVDKVLEPLNALGRLSYDNFVRIIAEENLDCSFSTKGSLVVYNTAGAFESGKEDMELMQRFSIPVERLDAAAVKKKIPGVLDSVKGGYLTPGDAYMHPGKFFTGLKNKLREAGVEFIPDSPVRDFIRNGDSISQVATARGNYEAEDFVLCAGAWSGQIGQMLNLKLPIQPARGYSMTMKKPAGGPDISMILGERKTAVTPMGEFLRVTGRLEIGNFSTVPDPVWIKRIQAGVSEYLNLGEKPEVLETWAGLRPVSSDGYPAIGRPAKIPNLIIATGHAMLGLTYGTGTGQLVTEIANATKPTININPLTPNRF